MLGEGRAGRVWRAGGQGSMVTGVPMATLSKK